MRTARCENLSQVAPHDPLLDAAEQVVAAYDQAVDLLAKTGLPGRATRLA